MEDISEGQTSFVAEVWVAPQFLEKGLSEGLSGADPEPLGSSVPGYHLAVHILGGLPVKAQSNGGSPVGISVISPSSLAAREKALQGSVT